MPLRGYVLQHLSLLKRIGELPSPRKIHRTTMPCQVLSRFRDKTCCTQRPATWVWTSDARLDMTKWMLPKEGNRNLRRTPARYGRVFLARSFCSFSSGWGHEGAVIYVSGTGWGGWMLFTSSWEWRKREVVVDVSRATVRWFCLR